MIDFDEFSVQHHLTVQSFRFLDISRGTCSCGWRCSWQWPGWNVAGLHTRHFVVALNAS